MKKLTYNKIPKAPRFPDPEDSWALIELYRWQHGHLPGETGTEEKELDIVEGV